MSYETIPSFDNMEYKADIRDKVLIPMIEQHNRHSEELGALEGLRVHADVLDDLSAITPDLQDLAAGRTEIEALVANSEQLKKVAAEADTLVTLHNRVTHLEIDKLNSVYTDTGAFNPEVEINRIDQELVQINNDQQAQDARIASLESNGTGGNGGSTDLGPLTTRVEAIEGDVADHEARITVVEGALGSGGNGGSGTVISVNGETGAVVLDAADVGALPLTGGEVTGKITLGDVNDILTFDGRGGTNDFSWTVDTNDGHSLGVARANVAWCQKWNQDGTIDFFGDVDVSDSNLKERGERVYSPNNKPTADDVGTYTKAQIDNKIAASGGTGGGSSMPSKFYVLPLGGQSNCEGHAEANYDLTTGEDNTDPRIWQLGRWSFTNAQMGYGDRFDELRPYSDCNLKLIPSVPCLDHVFADVVVGRQVGGHVGPGHYLAKKLLKYIPDDYGILIVPCARGGSAFRDDGGNGNQLGSWNASRKSASSNSGFQGLNADGSPRPLANDLYERTAHCLSLNPENRLLPVIWVQGESDDAYLKKHYDGFKRYFEWFRDKIEANFEDRLPDGKIKNFRWIACSPTKWANYATVASERDFVNHKANLWGLLPRWSTYNNYVFLSDLYKQADGESQLQYARIDIDEFGVYTETNVEHGNDSSVGGNPRWGHIHFGTGAYRNSVPRIMCNAILRYGKLPGADLPAITSRKVWGGFGSMLTDGCVFEQTFTPELGNMSSGLIVHQDFSEGTITTNKVSGVTVSGGNGMSLVNDSIFGRVAQCSTSGIPLTYTVNRGSESYTKSFIFSGSTGLREVWNKKEYICSSKNGADSGFVAFQGSSLFIAPNTTATTVTGTGAEGESGSWSGVAQSLLVAAAVEGGWKGTFEDWQHLAITYHKESKIMSVYLNGHLVKSEVITAAHAMNVFTVGGHDSNNSLNFSGKIASTRVYDRCLSQSEVQGLTVTDLLSHTN